MTHDAGSQIPPQTGNLVPQGNGELRVGDVRVIRHHEKPASDYPEVLVGQQTLVWTGTDWVDVQALITKAETVARLRALIAEHPAHEVPVIELAEINRILDGGRS